MKAQRGACPARPATTTICAAARYVAKYTINPAIAQGMARACRLGRGRQAGRPRALVAGLLRRQAGPGDQGRHHRRGTHGRSQCLDPDAAAGALPLDVRRASAGLRRPCGVHFCQRRRGEAGLGSTLGLRRECVAVREHPRRDRQECHDAQRRHARYRGRPRDLRGARRRRAADLRAGHRCCRWPSATSCSDRCCATQPSTVASTGDPARRAVTLRSRASAIGAVLR